MQSTSLTKQQNKSRKMMKNNRCGDCTISSTYNEDEEVEQENEDSNETEQEL